MNIVSLMEIVSLRDIVMFFTSLGLLILFIFAMKKQDKEVKSLIERSNQSIAGVDQVIAVYNQVIVTYNRVIDDYEKEELPDDKNYVIKFKGDAKIFLGGTCGDSTWREDLIKDLQGDFFNPVVKDWTEECQAIEEYEKRENCNIHLYVITKEMRGVFSIAEAIESAMTPQVVTVFHVMPCGFALDQLKSLEAVGNMVKKHGGVYFCDQELNRSAIALNCLTPIRKKAK